MISGLILPSVIQTQTFTKELWKEVSCADSQNVNIPAVLNSSLVRVQTRLEKKSIYVVAFKLVN